MSNSLINCILDTSNSLYQNIHRLSSRKDLITQIDDKLFDILISNIFAQGELESTPLNHFLRLLEQLSNDKPFLFDQQRLTLVNLIFQRNEYLITRKADKFELFLQILANLKDRLEYLGSGSLSFVMGSIMDFTNSRNSSNPGTLVEINCLVLAVLRNVENIDQEKVKLADEDVFKILKNIIQHSKHAKNCNLIEEGLSFWLHKFIEDTKFKSKLIDLIVTSPTFLLIFKIRNVSTPPM